jgi:DNA-binding transcriptional LysR family regulator
MDLRKLQYLIEVIEKGSLGSAAKALGVSQPALTKSLRLLESELSVRLLNRSTTGVTPTEFGRSLYARARAIMADINHAHAEINQLKGETPSYVRLACLPSVGALVARAVVRVTNRDNDLTIRVVEKQNYELLPALRQGEFDFIVAYGNLSTLDSGFKERQIMRDSLSFVVRHGHPLARRRTVELIDVVDYSWIFPIVGATHFPLIKQLFSAAGLKAPLPRIECGSMQFAKSVILQSDSIGILAKQAIEFELRSRHMALLPYENKALRRTISIYYREHHPLSLTARRVMAEIERTFRQ